MITAQNIFKSYDRYPVLKGMDFSIPEASFTALMGESGSGKSTLLNLLSGIDLVSGGELNVFNWKLHEQTVQSINQYRRETVGIVFQDFNLLPTLSAWDNVVLPMKLQSKPVDEEWVRYLFEEVNMTPHLKKFPEQLSGGEMQRVAIARALAVRPKLLIADEPTGSLDSGNSSDILDLLQAVNRDINVTIVMATHSKTAAGYADSILKIEDGLIIDG